MTFFRQASILMFLLAPVGNDLAIFNWCETPVSLGYYCSCPFQPFKMQEQELSAQRPVLAVVSWSDTCDIAHSQTIRESIVRV